jgi:hypothetical protein
MKNGVSQTGTEVPFDDPFTILIQNPNSSGTVFYTFNGIDPRKPGGGIFAASLFSPGDFSIRITSSTVIMARVFDDGKWSALKTISFARQNEDYNDLKVTELNYNPPDLVQNADTTFGKDLEFIEFKNTGKSSINLGGLAIDSAVTCSIPGDLLLPPGRFFVLASDTRKFYNFYGIIPSGEFKGNFSNSGEEILIKDNTGKKIINFSYIDSYPWPSDADGNGFTLSSAFKNPTGDPADHSYWKDSYKRSGTPFADDDSSDPAYPVISNKGKLLAYPNPSSGNISLRLATGIYVSSMDVRIYNIAGHMVTRFVSQNPAVIDLNQYNLEAGVYFIRCTSGIYDARIQIVFLK